jgi:hypothetical protein
MAELRKISLGEALRPPSPWYVPPSPLALHVISFDPVSRMFRLDYGTSVGLRPSLAELGLEVVFTKEELELQGRAGVARKIRETAGELERLIQVWSNAPE